MSEAAWLLIAGCVLLAPAAIVLIVNVGVWLWGVLTDYEARAFLLVSLVWLSAIFGAGCVIAAIVSAVSS
ncbi:hypothetical protein [Williamsia serinedens]